MGNELSFVTLEEQVEGTVITIDSRGLTFGIYTLVLESFDNAGGVYSALKTDIISLYVV